MKRIRLNNIFNYVTCFLLIPFAVMLVILLTYSIYQDISHQKQAYHTAAEDIADSVEASAAGILKKLRNATYSKDFIYFCNSSDLDTVERCARPLLDESSAGLFAYPEVIAVSLYNAKCEYSLHSSRSFETMTISKESEEASKALTEQAGFLCTTKEIDGDAFFFYSIADRYGVITAMVDPGKNSIFKNYNSIYKDATSFSFTTRKVSAEKDVFSTELPSVNLFLSYSCKIPYEFSPIQIVLLIIILFLLFLIPISLWILTRSVSRPLHLISEKMQTITAGNFDDRIPPIETIDDIRVYANGINLMLDAIQHYKEDDFNSRMDTVQAQLQYLQLQIRPHFYLNCMKNLNSLIALGEYQKAQTMVLNLSHYISHTFSDSRQFISVREELESIQNYVDLYNNLSYDIKLGFRIDGQCAGMNCLPMMLLTFVENSIKHTKTNARLSVFVSVESFQDTDGNLFLKFTLQDSGGGFPDTVLEEQNAIDPSKLIYRQNHIGINNIRFRLFLVFGSKASLFMRNEGNGALVEIITPCEQNKGRQFYEYADRG